LRAGLAFRLGHIYELPAGTDTLADSLIPPPYGKPINLETAKKVADAAIAETAKRNWNALCVSIVNPSGDLFNDAR
jgi:hypothetical protein